MDPLAIAGIGMGLNALGGFFGASEASKEQSKMRQFLERVYNDYINNPLYTGSRDFALQLLKTGDYDNIFYGAYQQALARNRANLLNAETQMQSAAARGGLLRGGQYEDLLGRQRETQFASDRNAAFDLAKNQFGAKQYAAGLSESLAKGPLTAAMGIAPSMVDPNAGSAYNLLGNLGGAIANFGMGQYGQQQRFDQLNSLFGHGTGTGVTPVDTSLNDLLGYRLQQPGAFTYR